MRIFGLAASVIVIASSANAQNAETPLFATFKSFCIDTAAQPLAVKAAVEAAGGTQDPSGSVTGPFPMTAAVWVITVGGRKMTVLAGRGRVPPEPPQIVCSISSQDTEDASVAAIRDWVGVPPFSPSQPLPSWLTIYKFQENGSVRIPITDEAALRAADARGVTSSLVVIQPPSGGTHVQLFHDFEPNP